MSEADTRPRINGGRGDCMKMEEHLPHSWEFIQDWGPQVIYIYYCHGVKSVAIERYEVEGASGEEDNDQK